MSRCCKLHVVRVCLSGMDPSPRALEQDKRVKFEIYQAETKPAPGLTEATEAGSNKKLYLPKKAALTNEDVAEVKSGKDSSGSPVIEIMFTKEGAKKMKKTCEDHMEKPMAVLVDGKIICAPSIRAVISEKAIIQGPSAEEVEKIVKGMNGK